jgi:hypothetical protein
MAKLLVKNYPKTFLKGDVVSILPDDHIFGLNESKLQFIAQGGSPDDWSREFIIVNIHEPIENLQFLLDSYEDGTRRYYITEQYLGSPMYNDLSNLGECTTTLDFLTSQIIDRGE